MGKRNPHTTRLPHLAVREQLHREVRLLAADRNASIQDVAEELVQRGLAAIKAECASAPGAASVSHTQSGR